MVKMYYIKSKDVNFISAHQSTPMRQNPAIMSVWGKVIIDLKILYKLYFMNFIELHCVTEY